VQNISKSVEICRTYMIKVYRPRFYGPSCICRAESADQVARRCGSLCSPHTAGHHHDDNDDDDADVITQKLVITHPTH